MAQTIVKETWGEKKNIYIYIYNPEVYTAINLREKILIFSPNS